MTPSTETPNHAPATPELGRQLHTIDQLLDELNTHFLPGQYVHLETWNNPQSSNKPATYSIMEGYMWEDDDDFIGIGHIDRGANKPSEQRASIETTGDEGAIMVTVPATGTLVIQDASSPGVTYQLTARTPVFDGPTVTGPLVNDKGQESPFDVAPMQQVWKDLDLDCSRYDDYVDRTVYRHEVHDGDGTLMGCIETADGGQTWQACKWYSFDEMFAAIDAFEPSASISDNAELVYREAGGTGRWTKCTMIEIPLFDMVA